MDDAKAKGAKQASGLSDGLIAVVLIGIVAMLAIRAMQPGNEDRESMPLPPLEVAGWINTDVPLTADALHGQVVLIDCWATWCGPCVEKMPQLVEFHQRYRDQGLVVIGLTPETGDEVTDVRSYVESVRGLDWPVGYGAQIPFDIMEITAIPTFVLFDKSGRSVWSGHGFSGLDDAVVAALARDSS